MVLRSEGRSLFLELKDVIWVEAQGNRSIVHCEDASYPIRGSLSAVAERLKDTPVVRIHRSTMVNVERVRSMERTPSGDFQVELEKGTMVRMSRKFRTLFYRTLNRCVVTH